MESRLEEALAIAERIVAQGRRPTPAERERFLALREELAEDDDAKAGFEGRVADMLDRFAAALEGMGI